MQRSDGLRRAPPRTSIHDVGLGSYEPLLELASGGMAKVYLARHVGVAGFERLVVVKRVHRHLASSREFRDMFREEARLCSTVQHPNVVAVVDTVEADGELFLVLEYVESLSLDALIHALAARGERLAPAVVVRIFADVLAGLHAAHEAADLRGTRLELIHRDVSPQNVVVGRDGTSRLLDFGIAKAASRGGVTHSGVIKGKLRYMSPEQVQQKPLDRRTDVFSAGVVIYEALTGERPFAGEDDGDVALGILLAEPPPPSSLARRVPRALDAVVARALARDRDVRFQTAAELQQALERAAAPASSIEVARAVERCGGEELDERRALLRAALEVGFASGPASGRRIAVRAEGHGDGGGRAPPVPSARMARSATQGSRWLALVAVIAAIVAIAAAIAAHVH